VPPPFGLSRSFAPVGSKAMAALMQEPRAPIAIDPVAWYRGTGTAPVVRRAARTASATDTVVPETAGTPSRTVAGVGNPIPPAGAPESKHRSSRTSTRTTARCAGSPCRGDLRSDWTRRTLRLCHDIPRSVPARTHPEWSNAIDSLRVTVELRSRRRPSSMWDPQCVTMPMQDDGTTKNTKRHERRAEDVPRHVGTGWPLSCPFVFFVVSSCRRCPPPCPRRSAAGGSSLEVVRPRGRRASSRGARPARPARRHPGAPCRAGRPARARVASGCTAPGRAAAPRR
jgi:hypothetical protein